jgi:hypothetical protein
MKTWVVRSKGRLEKIIIFYFILAFMMVAFLLVSGRRGATNFTTLDSDDIFEVFLTFSPFWIPLLIVTLKRLLSSKIPKELTFDDELASLIVIYSGRKQEIIPLEKLAYSHSDLNRSHVSLTFYKTFYGTRDQLVYKEVVQVIGMKWTLSWTTGQLKELIAHMEALEISKRLNKDEHMSLFDKIIST